jgi:hypothetical protein
MNKLFKDYLPYLVEIEEPIASLYGKAADYKKDYQAYIKKRYPTKALKWKSFTESCPQSNWFCSTDNGQHISIKYIFRVDSLNPQKVKYWID